MGKKLRTDPQFDPDKPFVSVTASTDVEEVPTFDPNQDFTPVKKNGKPSVSLQSEDGSKVPEYIEPGTDSQKPAERSKEPTPGKGVWSPFVDFLKTLKDIPEYAARTAFGTAVDQIPAEFKTEDLRNTKGTMEAAIIPQTSLNSSGFQSTVIDPSLKGEYGKWNNALRIDVRFKPDAEKAKMFLQEKFGKEYETKQEQFNKELVDYRLGLEKEIQQQHSEYAKKLGTAPQDVSEVTSGNVGKFIGNLAGQAIGRIPASVLTAGGASIIAERSAVFNEQLDQLANKFKIPREEVIRRGLDDPESGRVLADFLALTDIASLGNVLSGTGKKALKKGIGVAIETSQEIFQGEGEAMGGTLGANTDYEFSGSRAITSGLGGLIGSSTVSAILPGEKSAKDVVSESKNQVQSTIDLKGAERAAEDIQAKVNQVPNEVVTQPVAAIPKPAITTPTVDEQFKQPVEEVVVAKPVDEAPQPEYVEIEDEEIKRQAEPIMRAMVDIERQFQNQGLTIDRDHDDQTIVQDKEGNIVDPEAIPKDLRELAGDYEQATAKLGDIVPEYPKYLNKVRQEYQGEEAKFEEVKPKELPAAVIKTPEGQPQTFYHASPAKTVKSASKLKPSHGQQFGKGIYFGSDKETLTDFGDNVFEVNLPSNMLDAGTREYSQIVNKVEEETGIDPASDKFPLEKVNDEVKRRGYKGLIMKNDLYGGTEAMVFDAKDIIEVKKEQPVTPSKPETKKASRERLLSEPPTSVRQAVLQYFGRDGKINPESLAEETGMGAQSKRGLRSIRGKEAAKKRQRMMAKDAPSIDRLAEEILDKLPEGIAQDDDVRNEIIDILMEHETPEAMLESLKAFDTEVDFEAMERAYHESIAQTVDAMADEDINKVDQRISTFNGENDIFDLEATVAALDAGEFDEFTGLVDQINNELEELGTSQTQPSGEGQDRAQGSRKPETTEGQSPPPGNLPPTGPGATLTPKPGERETIVKLQDQSTLTEPLKESIEDFKNYTQHKQSKTQEEARETIDRLGEDEALREATSFKRGRTQEQKIALLSELAERFATKFRQASEGPAKQAAYAKFMQAMETLSEYITDTAQALSYMGLVGQMFETKAGAIRFARNQIDQSREGALRNLEGVKENAKKILEEKATMEEEIRRRVEEKVQQTVGERLAKAKLITKEQKKKIVDAFDKLKIDTKGGNIVTASVIPGLTLLPHIWNGSVEVMKQAVLTGADVANAIQAGIDYIKQHTKEAFDESKLKDYLTPIISDLTTERKANTDKIIKKYLPKKEKQARKRKEFYEKVVELSNAGAVSDRQLDDALAQIFELPNMTPEIAEKISEFVDVINKAPDGRFKNIAIQKLTDYIAQQQKFNVTDYIIASYKAGIFSGIDTQALNLQGNMFNVLELGFMLGMINPRAGARFFRAVGNQKSLSRAGMEGLQILKTGFDPRDIGGKRRALERHPRSFLGFGKPLKGWKQAFDPSLEQQKKYVFRALSAGDILFSSGINEGLQTAMYYREAEKQGLKGKEAQMYVYEQMGYTPENIAKANAQAEKEAADGAIPNNVESKVLRSYEIIEQQRDPEVVQRARQYAAEQIMTNTPKGFIGILARNLNNLIREIPILSAFIPVVNFAANAMSRAVQYMPHTVILREIAHGVTNKAHGVDFTTQIKDMMERLKSGDLDTEMRLRRAAAGTISLAIMIGLLSDDEDDKNLLSELLGVKVKIHGFGPGTQLDRGKNYQLQESGWKPYSIQVGDKYFPYQNYPALNVLLATMGEWNDAKRYGKLSNKDAAERFAFAMQNSFRVIAEMGFLTSLNTLVSSLLEGNVGTFISNLSRSAGGFIPKFQKNLINLFDSRVYSRNGILEIITRSIPVINQTANEPLVNALGEPIEKNWWDRIQLWNEDTYTKYAPIWEANNEKKYYFPVPSKFNVEQKFGRRISSKEYNDYFKYRGEEIIEDWKPAMTKLDAAKYRKKMDRIVQFADYNALVKMGVMESQIMKEINDQLQDVTEIKGEMREISKDMNP